MRYLLFLSVLTFVGCQQSAAQPVVAVAPVARAAPAPAAEATATPAQTPAIVPPVVIAAEVLAQAPPPPVPGALSVTISGNVWRGGSLDGTYTLTRVNSRDLVWRFDLLAPIGGVTRFEASPAPDGRGGRRLFVRAYEPRTPASGLYTRMGWCNYSPPLDPSGWSGVVCGFRVGNAGGSICPVAGTATVDAL
jgi:hypothetical protein